MSGVLVYDSNNSGGNWWLTDDDWQKLEDAGWIVYWKQSNRDYFKFAEFPKKIERKEFRFLGASAVSAAKRFETPKEGILEWQKITGQDAADLGCACCGNPHNFYFHKSENDYEYISVETPEKGSLAILNED